MDLNKTILEKKNNTIIFTFIKDESFDSEILLKMEKTIKELDQEKTVQIELIGLIPIEALAYLNEVSKYCKMILTIHEDAGKIAEQFINKLQEKLNTKLILRTPNG